METGGCLAETLPAFMTMGFAATKYCCCVALKLLGLAYNRRHVLG